MLSALPGRLPSEVRRSSIFLGAPVGRYLHAVLSRVAAPHAATPERARPELSDVQRSIQRVDMVNVHVNSGTDADVGNVLQDVQGR